MPVFQCRMTLWDSFEMHYRGIFSVFVVSGLETKQYIGLFQLVSVHPPQMRIVFIYIPGHNFPLIYPWTATKSYGDPGQKA